MTRNKSVKQEFVEKHFTIEEAEQMLPMIEKVIKRTIKLNKALDLLSSIEMEVYDDDYENLRRITKLNKHFHKLSYEFYANIEEIEGAGCIIKDLEIGIIDFYSRFDGREIFLCWRLGEKKIMFWHEVDSGYAGRKPIIDLSRRR